MISFIRLFLRLPAAPLSLSCVDAVLFRDAKRASVVLSAIGSESEQGGGDRSRRYRRRGR